MEESQNQENQQTERGWAMDEHLVRAIAHAVAYIDAEDAYDEWEFDDGQSKRNRLALDRRDARDALTNTDMDRLRGVGIVTEQEKRMAES